MSVRTTFAKFPSALATLEPRSAVFLVASAILAGLSVTLSSPKVGIAVPKLLPSDQRQKGINRLV